jgi:hypothetical protein
MTNPADRLLWPSAALPGAVHDVHDARTHGIPAGQVGWVVALLTTASTWSI